MFLKSVLRKHAQKKMTGMHMKPCWMFKNMHASWSSYIPLFYLVETEVNGNKWRCRLAFWLESACWWHVKLGRMDDGPHCKLTSVKIVKRCLHQKAFGRLVINQADAWARRERRMEIRHIDSKVGREWGGGDSRNLSDTETRRCRNQRYSDPILKIWIREKPLTERWQV